MRFPLLALAIVATLSACAGPRPADLPLHYAAAPASTSVISHPGVRLADDPALDGLLNEVARAFLTHDWRDLAYTLEPAEYARQFAFFQSQAPDRSPEEQVAQILRETFGLGFRDNNLAFPDGRDAPPFARLNRIQTIRLDAYDAEGKTVTGSVALEDGSSRRISFYVGRFEDRWVVTVPAG